VVEENAGTVDHLTGDLRRYGHEVDHAATGAEALDAHHLADLVLLGLNLPDLDGLEVCRGIRAICDTPVITVTTRSTELDRVLGLQAGSDDYIVKPYGFRELLARMDAVMRRTRPRVALPQPLEYGSLGIDPATREVRVQGQPVCLTRKEFDLLYLLAVQPRTVVSRQRIMADVWDYDSVGVGSSRTLDTHVSSLRNKLGAAGWILTVRGVGFRLGPG
jgi:DNA-binding response OmpR family regulator